MTFGWEGFSFTHPEDWAPVTISGNRSQGYARVASPGALILQVRWKQLKRPADAEAFLSTYLGKLRKDSERSNFPFRSNTHLEGGRHYYEYWGQADGRGVLFQPDTDGRTFVLEAASTKKESMATVLRHAMESFCVGSGRERWSAYGLDLNLPEGLTVGRREFLSGKTKLEWFTKGVHLFAERWGFADQLLARHGIEEWTRGVSREKVLEVQAEPQGFRATFRSPRNGFHEALVVHQPARNQLVLIRSEGRDPKWRPEWDWFN